MPHKSNGAHGCFEMLTKASDYLLGLAAFFPPGSCIPPAFSLWAHWKGWGEESESALRPRWWKPVWQKRIKKHFWTTDVMHFWVNINNCWWNKTEVFLFRLWCLHWLQSFGAHTNRTFKNLVCNPQRNIGWLVYAFLDAFYILILCLHLILWCIALTSAIKINVIHYIDFSQLFSATTSFTFVIGLLFVWMSYGRN